MGVGVGFGEAVTVTVCVTVIVGWAVASPPAQLDRVAGNTSQRARVRCRMVIRSTVQLCGRVPAELRTGSKRFCGRGPSPGR